MMSNYIVRLAVVLSVIAVICSAAQVKEFRMEQPCTRVGGMCIMKDECPVAIETKYLGLCPAQQGEGAECCHGISTKEHRCQKFGGECVPASSPCADTHLKVSRATDCSSNEVCCVLV